MTILVTTEFQKSKYFAANSFWYKIVWSHTHLSQKLYCWFIDYPFLMHCGIEKGQIATVFPHFYPTVHQKGIINESTKHVNILEELLCVIGYSND